jgi:ribosomal protein L14E/L6E/L27E
MFLKLILVEGYVSELMRNHSETTPLIERNNKRKNLMVWVVLVVLLTIWGPYILSGVYIEKLKWHQELEQRREAEQSRIENWERMLKARQRQEKVRQDKWDQRQGEVHREEARRREQERQREDEWQREEEERQRLGLHWDTLVADLHCTAHNTREYSARLLNTVPYNYNWLKPCEEIPIEIHGRRAKTTRCYINPYVRFLIHLLSKHQDDDYS